MNPSGPPSKKPKTEGNSGQEVVELDAACGFSQEELNTAIKVLGIVKDDEQLYKSKPLRPLRKIMYEFTKLTQRSLYGGMSKVEYQSKMLQDRRSNKRTRKDLDKKLIETRKLRMARMNQLNALTEKNSDAIPMIPDGAVNDMTGVNNSVGASGGSNTVPQVLTVDAGKGALTQGEDQAELNCARACYICKRRFTKLHQFYDQLCPSCADINWEKRLQKCDLRGRVAVLTGGRVKIGYQIGLKLLRCGAKLIVTTRFPADAALRYSREQDYAEWKDRLSIFGIDLRDIAAVEQFTSSLNSSLDRLDIIINNACQTIRRPAAYYRHLLDTEAKALKLLHQDASVMELLANNPGLNDDDHDSKDHAKGALDAKPEVFDVILPHSHHGLMTAPILNPVLTNGKATNSEAECKSLGLGVDATSTTDTVSQAKKPAESSVKGGQVPSAMLSQLPLTEEDHGHDETLFPKNRYDVNGQQIDLRSSTSWLLKLGEIPTTEMVEVMAVNSLAPFIINSKLKALMARSKDPEGKGRYIVNVSAMEGKFYRFKNANHPHTNMAKAALNMMTRTSAQDYVKSGIWMTAVDTGWINDENPLEIASRIAKENNFQTPIDEVDAAARVLDPVMSGVEEIDPKKRPHGVFLKDYKETEW